MTSFTLLQNIRRLFKRTPVPYRAEFKRDLRAQLVQLETSMNLNQTKQQSTHAPRRFWPWALGLTPAAIALVLVIALQFVPTNNPVTKSLSALQIKEALAASIQHTFTALPEDTFQFLHVQRFVKTSALQPSPGMLDIRHDVETAETDWNVWGYKKDDQISQRIDTIFTEISSKHQTARYLSSHVQAIDKDLRCATEYAIPYPAEHIPYSCYNPFLPLTTTGSETQFAEPNGEQFETTIVKEGTDLYIQWISDDPIVYTASINFNFDQDGRVNTTNALHTDSTQNLDARNTANTPVQGGYQHRIRIPLEERSVESTGLPMVFQITGWRAYKENEPIGYADTKEQISPLYQLKIDEMTREVTELVTVSNHDFFQMIEDQIEERKVEYMTYANNEAESTYEMFIAEATQLYERVETLGNPIEQIEEERDGHTIVRVRYSLDGTIDQLFAKENHPTLLQPQYIDFVMDYTQRKIMEYRYVSADEQVLQEVKLLEQTVITDITPEEFFTEAYWKNDLGIQE